jgi:hypothetical protein
MQIKICGISNAIEAGADAPGFFVRENCHLNHIEQRELS